MHAPKLIAGPPSFTVISITGFAFVLLGALIGAAGTGWLEELDFRLRIGPTQPIRPTLVGHCYRLHLGAWTRPVPQWANDLLHQAPPWFQLSADRVGYVWHKVRPDVHVPGTTKHLGLWRPAPHGHLVLAWSDGFTGLHLTFGLRGDTLVGVASVSSDAALTPDAVRYATATLTPCMQPDTVWSPE